MLEAQQNKEPGIEHLNPRHFASLPSNIFVAGAETTSTSPNSAILALLTHPHVLRTAPQEIDAVVGTSRSPPPRFSDPHHLPYIHAIVQEVLPLASRCSACCAPCTD